MNPRFRRTGRPAPKAAPKHQATATGIRRDTGTDLGAAMNPDMGTGTPTLTPTARPLRSPSICAR